MDSFKPTTPPLSQRLISSFAVQITLLLLVAGGAGFYLFNKSTGFTNQPRFTNSRTFLQISPSQGEGASDNASSNSRVEENLATESAPASASSDSVNAFKVADPQNAAGVLRAASAESASAAALTEEEEKDNNSAAAGAQPKLTVYYAEVNRGTLMNMFNSSRSTGQFMSLNDYSAGILTNLESSLKSSQVKILHKLEHSIETERTLQWSYGLKDRHNPEVEIGLTTFVDLSDVEPTSLRGNIEIQRNWRELSPSGVMEVQRKSFPAIFEIGGGTGFFMSGVLPHITPLEDEEGLTQQAIYKILKSPQFKDGESEFVIFVEYRK